MFDVQPVDCAAKSNNKAASAPCLDARRTDDTCNSSFVHLAAISGEAALPDRLKSDTTVPQGPTSPLTPGEKQTETDARSEAGMQCLTAAPTYAPCGAKQPAVAQGPTQASAGADSALQPAASYDQLEGHDKTVGGSSAHRVAADIDGDNELRPPGPGDSARGVVETHGLVDLVPNGLLLLPSILSLAADIADLVPQPGRPGNSGVLLGTWQDLKVAVKLSSCPNAEACAALLYAANYVTRNPHPNLLAVYQTRLARADEAAMAVLDPPPMLRPGWMSRRRPAGRLQRFISTHVWPEQLGVASGASRENLTVFPGDVIVRPPPVEPAQQALLALNPEVGGFVVASVIEFSDMGDLHSSVSSEDSPFRARRTWSLHVAQRALLRTAREVASALRHLHAAGITHGALRPAAVLLSRSAADRRGFITRLAGVGSSSRSHTASNPLTSGPAMVLLAPEVLCDGLTALSPAADVYSYGMLLYFMAAGEMPFDGEHLLPVLTAVTTQGLRPEWPTGQHDHLAPLFRRCVAQEPGLRPTSEQVLEEVCALEQRVKDGKAAKALKVPPLLGSRMILDVGQ